VKIQSIAPIDGRRWPVGHTALVSEEYGTELIDAGVDGSKMDWTPMTDRRVRDPHRLSKFLPGRSCCKAPLFLR